MNIAGNRREHCSFPSKRLLQNIWQLLLLMLRSLSAHIPSDFLMQLRRPGGVHFPACAGIFRRTRCGMLLHPNSKPPALIQMVSRKCLGTAQHVHSKRMAARAMASSAHPFLAFGHRCRSGRLAPTLPQLGVGIRRRLDFANATSARWNSGRIPAGQGGFR